MTKKYKPIFDDNWFDFSGLFGFIRMTAYVMVFVFFAVILWTLFIKDGSNTVSSAIKRHDKLILVETLARIPKGPYLHRIVDLELNRVCYLNAAGGGIQCFSLDTFTLFDEELKVKLKKQENKLVPKWRLDPYPYKNNAYRIDND